MRSGAGSRGPDVLVLGGGVAGLAAAGEILKSGRSCWVLEKESQPGGLASSFEAEGFPVESFYHHFFRQGPAFRAVVSELGQQAALVWGTARMGIYSSSGLHAFSAPWDLLRFPDLTLSQKTRLAWGLLRLKREKTAAGLDGRSAAEWLSGWIGRAAFASLLAPLLQAKFGANLGDISAAFIRSRFSDRLGTRSRSRLREILGYHRGGLRALFGAWTKKIAADGGRVLCDCPVASLKKEGKVFRATGPGGESFEAPNVVSTIPLPVLTGILDGCAPPVLEISFRAMVCLVLGLDRPLSPYYWTSVTDGQAPFTVVVEQTRLVPPADYGGRSVVYLGRYDEEDSPVYRAGDGDVGREFLGGLKRCYPGFDERTVVWRRVSRALHATPVYRTGYGEALGRFARSLPEGLYLAGQALTYPDSRNINAVILTARRAAQSLMAGRNAD